MTSGIALIATERQRQQMGEGWTDAHDDEHDGGELAIAAACYASPVPLRAEKRVPCGCRSVGDCTHYFAPTEWLDPWPWDEKWDKRKSHDRIKQLTIAGALIAAEIDRLVRAITKESANSLNRSRIGSAVKESA